MTARLDTSPEVVAAAVSEWRSLVVDWARYRGGCSPEGDALELACDLIESLSTELGAERAEREAERLADLEEIVREHGMNVDDKIVDSCANSTVYRAMLDLRDAGRMTIEPGGVGRRIYGRWVDL